MYTFVTRGVYPIWYGEHEELVEYGLARFKSNSMTIEEPLALVGIIRFFDSHDITIQGNILRRLQDNKGEAFEEFTLLAITNLLQGTRTLGDTFEFYGGNPTWAHCKGQVVAQAAPGEFRPFDIVTHAPTILSTGVAFCAKTPKDLKAWITGDHQAGWCVPGEDMGPDIMTWVQLEDGRRLLLIVQVKCHLSGNKSTVTAETSADAIQSLVPARFFASSVC